MKIYTLLTESPGNEDAVEVFASIRDLKVSILSWIEECEQEHGPLLNMPDGKTSPEQFQPLDYGSPEWEKLIAQWREEAGDDGLFFRVDIHEMPEVCPSEARNILEALNTRAPITIAPDRPEYEPATIYAAPSMVRRMKEFLAAC